MTTVPERRNSFAETVRRGRLLQLASDRLGQQALAEAIGITPRALRMKLGMDRSITDTDLACASALLLADVQIATALAHDLRDACGPQAFGVIAARVVEGLEVAA